MAEEEKSTRAPRQIGGTAERPARARTTGRNPARATRKPPASIASAKWSAKVPWASFTRLSTLISSAWSPSRSSRGTRSRKGNGPIFRPVSIERPRLPDGLLHPNIVTVQRVWRGRRLAVSGDGIHEGLSLAQYMKQKGRLPVKESFSIMKKLLGALEYSHSKGVIHRDIKPQNVFILENLEVKLSDFGIAKMESSDLTKPGMVLGTPVYMSPEQIRAEKVDARSDLFSAGVIFYEMIAGERPFTGGQLPTLVNKILNESPRDPCSLNPDLPESFRKIFSKALAKKPEERYQTAGEFLASLQEAIESAPTLVIKHPPKPPDKKRLAVVALAILLIVGIAGAGVWHWTRKAPENGPDVEPALEQSEKAPHVEEDAPTEARDASTDARKQAEMPDANPAVEEIPDEQQAPPPTPTEETAVSKTVEEARTDLPDADASTEPKNSRNLEHTPVETTEENGLPAAKPCNRTGSVVPGRGRDLCRTRRRTRTRTRTRIRTIARKRPGPHPIQAQGGPMSTSTANGWGVTPFQGPLEPGNHRLELKKQGFRPMTDPILHGERDRGAFSSTTRSCTGGSNSPWDERTQKHRPRVRSMANPQAGFLAGPGDNGRMFKPLIGR